MLFLFRFFSVFPLWMLQGAGWLGGWLVYMVSGTYRRQFLANVRQAQMGWKQWSGAVGAGGQLLAELPRLWFGPAPAVLWEGAQHVDKALARGKGVVFLTPHLGCFEVTAQAYAQRYGRAHGKEAGRPMTVLYRPPRKAWLIDLVNQARRRPGLETAPTTLGGVKQLIKALKHGQCVGLLPDQVPAAGQGIWSPFFGRDAYTMTLAVRLALQTQSTLLFAWGERLSWGRGYRIHVSPLENVGGTSGLLGSTSGRRAGSRDPSKDRRLLARDLESAVHQVNLAMEQLVRTCPQQYLWGYARYKAPPGEGPPVHP